MKTTSIEQMEAVAAQLCKTSIEFAFLGGAVLGILITDPASPPIRTTLDVDVLVDTPTRLLYTALEEKLRKLGFKHDTTEGAPICRWLFGEIVIDVMPTHRQILGWESRWLSQALSNSSHHADTTHRVKIVGAPHFIAVKLEAFYGRGENDFMASHDMEDIVSVINGRVELLDEILCAHDELRQYLSCKFGELLKMRSFVECLPGHLGPSLAEQKRVAILLDRINTIAELS